MFPPAIIIVNNDLAPSTQGHLVRQLHINEVIDGYTFDGRVNDDPTYADKVKQLKLRIMVVRTFEDRANVSSWTLADVVIFVKQGLAAVEVNKFGPHGITYPVLKLNWTYLGING